MAIATLTFDLSVPEDAARFELHSQAEKLYWAVWELTNQDLRQIDKYDSLESVPHTALEFLTDVDGNPITLKTTTDKIDGGAMVSIIRDVIHEKLNEAKVSLELFS